MEAMEVVAMFGQKLVATLICTVMIGSLLFIAMRIRGSPLQDSLLWISSDPEAILGSIGATRS